MNCIRCHSLLIDVKGQNFRGDPYKYTCKYNSFISLPASDINGSSLTINSTVYYSENQLTSYCESRKHQICWKKHQLSTNNVISSSISILALLISISSVLVKQSSSSQSMTEKAITKNTIFIIDSLGITSNIEANTEKIKQLLNMIENRNSIKDSSLPRKGKIVQIPISGTTRPLPQNELTLKNK